MATHEQNIENLRTATYGEQVRGSMIELFEEDYNLVKDGVGVGTVISSVTDPTTGFSDGAVYINSSSWELFKLEGTAWSLKGVIKGDQGESVVNSVDNGDGTFYLVLSDGSRTANIATIQGLQGPQGPQGIQGDTGPQGRSVTSMTMTGTGKQHPVIATYSDGVSQTLGIIQDGADGQGTGDMSKATYDPNDHGYVDAAAALTDGTNIMPYSTVANKADSSTTLAGYGITDAYTKTQTNDRFVAKPDSSITAGKVPISDGSSGYTWETHADATYNKVSTNAQSGVAVEQAIEGSTHEVAIKTTASVAAGGTVVIPAPTISGNSVTYNYDPYIKDTSVIIPVSDSISGRPMKYRSAVTTTGTDGSGNTVGYVTITVAETIPANFNIGVLVINR